MKELMSFLFEISLYSSVLILTTLLIKVIFKDRVNIKIVVILWTTVLFRLIMPFTLASPIHLDSLVNNSSNIVESNTELTETVYDEENNDIVNRNTILETDIINSNLIPKDENVSLLSNQQPESNPKLSIGEFITSNIWVILFIIWISGFVIFLFEFLYKLAKFNIYLKNSRSIMSPKVREIFKTVKKELGIKKRVELLSCGYINVPVAYGFISPKILLPMELEKTLSEDKIKLVIMHELYHIKRNDLLKNYIWILAKLIHWFNPLVRIAYGGYSNDTEIVVDNMVIKKAGRDNVYKYSQSIVDVIKLSKNTFLSPISVSFCEDKIKLRKRVENMLKPKKKLKSAGFASMLLAVVMIVICFTTACQPTPDEIIVKSKEGEELQDAINATATPNTLTDNNDEMEAVTEHITNSTTNDLGTITVNIDANVVIPSVNKISTATVEKGAFTQEQVDKILEVLVGDAKKRDAFAPLTKEEIDEEIVKLKRAATDLNSDMAQSEGITSLAELQERADELISEWQEVYEDAPDAYDFTETDTDVTTPIMYNGEETISYVSFLADLGKEEMAFFDLSHSKKGECIEFRNFNSTGNTSIVSAITSDSVRPNGVNTSFDQAKQLALDTLTQMDIDGLSIGKCFIYEDNGLQYYGFTFNRSLNDVLIDYGSIGLNSAMNEDPAYNVPMGYEYLNIMIDDSGIARFEWYYPINTIEILNENVGLQYDAQQSTEIITKQLFVEYADLNYGSAEKIEIDITDIQLSLTRIRYKGHPGEYILVPVWDFYGNVKMQIPDSRELINEGFKMKYKEIDGMYVMNIPYQSISTINALDGTIINRELGY